jgi:hypothetical protein
MGKYVAGKSVGLRLPFGRRSEGVEKGAGYLA